VFVSFGLIARAVPLAVLIATALIARDGDRVSSLWRRAMLFATVAMVPRLLGNDVLITFTDGYLAMSALALASLLGGLLVQSARALHSGRRVQLGVGAAGAAAALLGSVNYFPIL
jgi:hypothetical protein